jgi:hypothetical protein
VAAVDPILLAAEETTMKRCLAAAALAAAISLPVLAADHRDGPLATNDPSADLNDVYLFNNPNDPGEVVIILTFHPDAPRNARFSDAIEYRTHIDNGTGEQLLTCIFTNGGNRIRCDGVPGLSVEGPIESVVDNGDLRVFAGLREDPFFFDVGAFNRIRAGQSPGFTNPGVNGFSGFNTLVITLGIRHDRLTGNGANPILKVWASSNRIGDIGISAGHSGVWYDAQNPGHGLFLHTLPAGTAGPGTPRQMYAYWAVYDNAGNQLNLYGFGPIVGDSATLPAVTHTGGRFPPAFRPDQLTETPFGTLKLDFTGCNTLALGVQPTRPGFQATTVQMSVLSPTENLPCTFHRAGQIDRNGRPAINTATINVLGPANGLKDTYNRATNPAGWAAAFSGEMQANLAALDTLDGITGNALLPPAALAGVLVDDRLVIDTRIANCGQYLAVELQDPSACGGRTLDRDVIDDSLGAIVGPGVSHNVEFESEILDEFPFIAPPRG